MVEIFAISLLPVKSIDFFIAAYWQPSCLLKSFAGTLWNNENVRYVVTDEEATCYLGGDACGDWRTEALAGGRFEGEEVGGSWVEAHEQVMGLVPQLEHSSSLRGHVSAGVQRAQSFVGDLEADRRSKVLRSLEKVSMSKLIFSSCLKKFSACAQQLSF